MSARESIRQKLAPARVPLARCDGCGLHLRLCLCASVRPLDLATRVVVLRHRKELHKPTNTGRLVPLTLVHGEVRPFGGRGVEFDSTGLIEPTRRTVLLYPMGDSRLLAHHASDPRPITLLVPDADWRRAHKLASHEPALEGIERVHLAEGPRSRYRLRHHPDPRFVATFEAVARALGILEGPDVQAQLEHVFQVMVDRMLWSRGRLATELVTGGVPDPIRESTGLKSTA